jgi:hypothetical protein
MRAIAVAREGRPQARTGTQETAPLVVRNVQEQESVSEQPHRLERRGTASFVSVPLPELASKRCASVSVRAWPVRRARAPVAMPSAVVGRLVPAPGRRGSQAPADSKERSLLCSPVQRAAIFAWHHCPVLGMASVVRRPALALV